jgi:hypothetical protein
MFIYHHPPHRNNVTVPHGRPKLRSRLHFNHNREGDHEVHDGHVVALDIYVYIYITYVNLVVVATLYNCSMHGH